MSQLAHTAKQMCTTFPSVQRPVISYRHVLSQEVPFDRLGMLGPLSAPGGPHGLHSAAVAFVSLSVSI